MASRRWNVVTARLDAQSAHDLDLSAVSGRELRIFVPTHPAIVLGSAQRTESVELAAARAAGFSLARRRSGGGLVVVDPLHSVWVDLAIPRDDPLFVDDVGRSMYWVGQLWSDALCDLGVRSEVHRGPLQRSPIADQLCFASTGPGEVLSGGVKVVGVAQRRTRLAARFQTLARLRPPAAAPPPAIDEAALLVGVAAIEAARRLVAAQRAAAPVAIPAAVVAALLRHLPV